MSMSEKELLELTEMYRGILPDELLPKVSLQLAMVRDDPAMQAGVFLGLTMAAMQHLNKRIKDLEAEVTSLKAEKKTA